MKRSRVGPSSAQGILTGGSGDVNPQILVVGNVNQTGNDSINVEGQGLPIPRLPISKGKSLVIELLSLDSYVTGYTQAAGVINQYFCGLTTNPTAPASYVLAAADPRVISLESWAISAIATAIGTSYTFVPLHFHADTTDEAGHGILIATDNIYGLIGSANTGASNLNVTFRLKYRFKEVSLEEYIGIVQSQQ